MRVFLGAAVLSVMLMAATTFAQAPGSLPEGARYAVVNVARIAAESVDGKTALGKVQALNQQKIDELTGMQKALQASQQKLGAGASVLSASAAARLRQEIEQQQVIVQRFTEDAQKDLQNLEGQLQADFEQKLAPVIEQIAKEMGLYLIFSGSESGIIWARPTLDLTLEVIAKLDAAMASTAAPAPAAQTPAPAPRPTTPR